MAVDTGCMAFQGFLLKCETGGQATLSHVNFAVIVSTCKLQTIPIGVEMTLTGPL